MRKPEKKLLHVWLGAGLLFSVVTAAVPATATAVLSDFSPVAVFLLVLALSGAAVSVYNVLRYRAWGFEMRADHLYIEHGVFRKIRSMVPYVRIQHVDTQRGVIERAAGLSRVVVYTAGSRGADVTLPGMLPAEAGETQEKLRDVAIESEDRDAV